MSNSNGAYHIRFVDDERMHEKDFAFAECDGEAWLLIKRSRVNEEVLEATWATYRKMTGRELADAS